MLEEKQPILRGKGNKNDKTEHEDDWKRKNVRLIVNSERFKNKEQRRRGKSGEKGRKINLTEEEGKVSI
jgi:hypothetical protein